jgi:hypothetical protein
LVLVAQRDEDPSAIRGEAHLDGRLAHRQASDFLACRHVDHRDAAVQHVGHIELPSVGAQAQPVGILAGGDGGHACPGLEIDDREAAISGIGDEGEPAFPVTDHMSRMATHLDAGHESAGWIVGRVELELAGGIAVGMPATMAIGSSDAASPTAIR